MNPIPSSEGENINWINYKTGLKGVYFRMEADAIKAAIRIELSLENSTKQQTYFSRLKNFNGALEVINKEWTWEPATFDGTGRLKSKIETTLAGVNLLNKEDWPLLISFFKQHLITLDKFWNCVKYSFEEYR